jgi:RNA polymerase sigma factor (TIGR02999 family)
VAFRIAAPVTEATRILSAIERGDSGAVDSLWAIVYEELRKLAARELAREEPGQTLQATALVHEAYVRLVGNGASPRWTDRRHFFMAAAKAMRNILVDNARRKKATKRGGNLRRDEVEPDSLHSTVASDDLLALDEALERLASTEPEVAELVKLRYFAGLSIPQAAATLGIAPRTANSWWAYARAWLLDELRGPKDLAGP